MPWFLQATLRTTVIQTAMAQQATMAQPATILQCRQITSIQLSAVTHTHTHTNTQTHKHTNTQTHKHTNTQTHKHTHSHKGFEGLPNRYYKLWVGLLRCVSVVNLTCPFLFLLASNQTWWRWSCNGCWRDMLSLREVMMSRSTSYNDPYSNSMQVFSWYR